MLGNNIVKTDNERWSLTNSYKIGSTYYMLYMYHIVIIIIICNNDRYTDMCAAHILDLFKRGVAKIYASIILQGIT